MFLLLSAMSSAALPAFPNAVYDQLKLRDGVECAALGPATSELKGALVALTDPDLMPASVPIRAAGCLVSLFPADAEVEATVIAWMTDPERQGLALVALSRSDVLPEAAAARIVAAGRASAISRVAAAADQLRETSVHPAVRALQ